MFRLQGRILSGQCRANKKRFYATEAAFRTNPYSLHRLEAGPSSEIALKKEEALQIYERMATIRKMESTVDVLYKQKIIRGFCHLYSGTEAVAVGVFANLRPQDTGITSYRNHAWAYLFGDCTVDYIVAELVGVRSGWSKGKGGSMHMYNGNFYGGNAIVGAQVPTGVGIALSHKYRNTDAVSLTVYGDGAANNGQVYEAFDMAKLWDLPCLFLCENNHYSMGTSVPRSTPNPDFYTKGDYIPGIRVDGMDVISVKEAARYAVEFVRSGKGPLILEADAYRYYGHSLSDPGTTYRTREEVQHVRKERDPIINYRNKLLEAKLVSTDELEKLDKSIKNVVNTAVEKAFKSEPLEIAELTYDIYSNEVIRQVRGVTPFSSWRHKTTGRLPESKSSNTNSHQT